MAAVNRIGQVLVETYRIDRLIAEGGMGSVYEAKHLRLPKRFAVKFLNLSLIGNHEAQARFKREAEIIAELDHPNIVNLLDYNVTEDGVPFIILEYLDGEHLGKRIQRGKIGIAEVLRILGPVVSALAAAHARDIVHRDLKPENIVLCRDDQVKVVDFGIAKIRDGQELTASNTILGTVPYMAPEQLFGTSVSARTDQFALAAIVYEMLTTEMAFGGPASVPEVAARVAHYQPPDVKGVSQAVNAALFQAMAKDPAARFPSVKSFLAALEDAAHKPDEPAVIVDDGGGLDEGLPPLAGEATMVNSIAPSAPDRERPSFGEDTGMQSLPEQGNDHGGAESSHGHNNGHSHDHAHETPGMTSTAVIDRAVVTASPTQGTMVAMPAQQPSMAAGAGAEETRELGPRAQVSTVQLAQRAMQSFAGDGEGTAQVNLPQSGAGSGPVSTSVAPTVMSAIISDREPDYSERTRPTAAYRDDHTGESRDPGGLGPMALWMAVGLVGTVLVAAVAWLLFFHK